MPANQQKPSQQSWWPSSAGEIVVLLQSMVVFYSGQCDQDLNALLQNFPLSQVSCFFHILMFLKQRVIQWCPPQFQKLAHAGMVKDAVWVRPFFSSFIQFGNIFIRLHSWSLYSLFPVLKLKQQRDDSELPAWKMEASSKMTKNFNSGLLIKWTNLKGPSPPLLQCLSFHLCGFQVFWCVNAVLSVTLVSSSYALFAAQIKGTSECPLRGIIIFHEALAHLDSHLC